MAICREASHYSDICTLALPCLCQPIKGVRRTFWHVKHWYDDDVKNSQPVLCSYILQGLSDNSLPMFLCKNYMTEWWKHAGYGVTRVFFHLWCLTFGQCPKENVLFLRDPSLMLKYQIWNELFLPLQEIVVYVCLFVVAHFLFICRGTSHGIMMI